MAHIEGNVLARFILNQCTEEESRFMKNWLEDENNQNTFRYMQQILGAQMPILK